jgi:hypothetical protein
MNPIKEIAVLERKLAAAKAKLTKQEGKRFALLAKKEGFQTIDLLIKALAAYASPVMKGKIGAGRATPAVSASKPAKAAGAKRKARAVITAELKAAVVADVKAGELSNAQIAKKHGLSVPSVQNIKKAAGLVSNTAKKAPKKAE